MNKTHDFSNREWGHNYTLLGMEEGGIEIRLAGWGMGLRENDYIIIQNGDGTTRYKLETVEYKSNPSDMWFANAVFAPRGYEGEDNGIL